MTNERRKTRYYCQECIVAFDIITWFESRRKHCPKCGEYLDVTTSKIVRRAWKKDELELLDKVIAGEAKIYQLVEMTGRPLDACRKKKGRRIAELKKEAENV